MEKKKKSKTKEFFENVGMVISIIWMLPILICEEIKEHCEKKRKEKEPKPDPVKFVCSECVETFLVENTEENLQLHGKDGEEHVHLDPKKCPKCHGMRTYPEGEEIGLYEKIWEMDELRSFLWDMEQDWLHTDTNVDRGLTEYRCTECGTVFKARDIGRHNVQHPFPARCPHCHHMKTLPTSETDQQVYEPLWTMLDLAEQTRKTREKKKILKTIALGYF